MQFIFYCKNIKEKMYYFAENMEFMQFIELNSEYKIFDINENHLTKQKTEHIAKVDKYYSSLNIKFQKTFMQMLDQFSSLMKFFEYNKNSYIFTINYNNNQNVLFRNFLNLDCYNFIFTDKLPLKIIFQKEKFIITERTIQKNSFVLNKREIALLKKYLQCFSLKSSLFTIFLIQEIQKRNSNILKFLDINGKEQNLSQLLEICQTNLMQEAIQTLY